MIDQDYLIHYGVLGMKWGVRKDKRSSGVKKRGKTKLRAYKRAAKIVLLEAGIGMAAGTLAIGALMATRSSISAIKVGKLIVQQYVKKNGMKVPYKSIAKNAKYWRGVARNSVRGVKFV